MKDENSLIPKNDDSTSKSKFSHWISEPFSKRGWPKWLVYIFAILGLLYMLNPTAGFFEFIPDNIPFLGNLDEGVAMMLVLAGLVEAFDGRKSKNTSSIPGTNKNNENENDIIDVDNDSDIE